MNIRSIIMNLSDKINDEHAQRILFDLDLEHPEALARIGGMSFTLEVLTQINGIEVNWYSFQGLRDRLIFILVYPLSVSVCYAVNDVKRIFKIKSCQG